MEYYKQGDATRAKEIKAAFERLGYHSAFEFNGEATLYFTFNGEVKTATAAGPIKNILKTHPDYKELELPVKPDFKVGDWVVKKDGNTFYGGNYAEQITLIEVDEKGKYIWLPSKTWVDADYIRLWTIADARDGDVLTDGKLIVIFNKLEEPAYKQHIIAYVGLDLCGKLQITEDTWQLGVDKAMPATREQRDFLFQKMKEAGYEWTDKKELRKIKHYDIGNFYVGMPVLVRDNKEQEWRHTTFSHISRLPLKFAAGCTYWCQCIPFEGNKHLLGTTDMPNEDYINW